MKMQTNLAGRLRNTSLPLANGLLPIFEAVVNSIHGIEEAGTLPEKGKVSVEIFRKQSQGALDLNDGKKKKGPDALEEIVGFRVTDNGVGFNDDNMQSFQELDTDHKISKGCRGIGRLLWLKAFSKVNVISVFEQEKGMFRKRSFEFSVAGVNKIVNEIPPQEEKIETNVYLDGFQARYREAFVRQGGAPEITVWDDGESLSLDALYDSQMHASAVTESITLNKIGFDLIHVKLRSNSLSTHAIAYCADNRLVTEERIEGKIPGLHGRISDDDGGFVYECYVSSKFLDEHSRPERTGFDIVESVDALLQNSELSLQNIRSAVLERAKIHLAPHLASNLVRSKERVEKFVSMRAPR